MTQWKINLTVTKGAPMPIIRVEMFSGRSVDAKQALVKELTDACVKTIRCKAEDVTVVLSDVEKTNWAEAGELVGRDPERRGSR